MEKWVRKVVVFGLKKARVLDNLVVQLQQTPAEGYPMGPPLLRDPFSSSGVPDGSTPLERPFFKL